MDNIQTQLPQTLETSLNLTTINYEKDPYILTPEEEEIIKNNHLAGLKKNKLDKVSKFAGSNPQAIIDQHDWSKVDYSSVLDFHNMLKNRKIENEKSEIERKEKEVEDRRRLKESWNARNMFHYLKGVSHEDHGVQFKLTEWNKKLVTAVCYFLSEDERFESELGFSFNKGLMIRGNVGVGKTFLIKCLSENGLNPISIYSMVTITNYIVENGYYNFKQVEGKLYLDDVGTEEPLVKNYGTPIRFFKDFIENAHLNRSKFGQFIVSTNLDLNDIEKVYGLRVKDRIKEMFNIITVRGDSFRGK